MLGTSGFDTDGESEKVPILYLLNRLKQFLVHGPICLTVLNTQSFDCVSDFIC